MSTHPNGSDDDGHDRKRRKWTGTDIGKQTLSRNDYTVGWICALPLEMTAGRAMFDEEHNPPANLPGDHNVYYVGAIHAHNTVITCLPLGSYGTGPAAVVARVLSLAFPAIKIFFMVGIGGGVPSSAHDIRLGDVVVSIPRPDYPPVVQYDFGKTEADGIAQPKGVLRKPPASLLKASASLESQYQMQRSKMQNNIASAFREHCLDPNTYMYPGVAKDVLFEPECEHSTTNTNCSSCGPRKLVVRPPRSTNVPRVHYGTIGSGNQVIKNARVRDRLAKAFDILCFETEAAGLMDVVDCLVVRGICDYCDTSKNKVFQGFAALTAAAFSKELLSVVHVQQSFSQPEFVDMPPSSKEIDKRLEDHSSMIAALDFVEVDVRRDTIKKAHAQTCNWLLNQKEYTDWLDPAQIQWHRGLLWIRGKPGTGKSTLMKFLLEHAEKTRNDDNINVSFFFNARGEELERSTLGMYRSFLSQLFKKCPSLRNVLDTIASSTFTDTWSLNALQTLFKQVVMHLESRSLFCYIDALDECPLDQMKELVEYLVDLGTVAIEHNIRLSICLSSRHYPNIEISAGIKLTLEEQEGHRHDLEKYIASELKIGRSKEADLVKQQVFDKSGRIFLWVVLVIRILKDEFDRGRVHTLRERLKAIPLELNELFLDILIRDNRNLRDLVACMQWILFARRAMKREEFYFALRADDISYPLQPWDSNDLTLEDMDRYILDCSKGLAELTKAKSPTVQFIHESVREFLLKPGVLVDLWPGFHDISPNLSHTSLKHCCNRYLDIAKIREIQVLLGEKSSGSSLGDKARKLFPFFDYAVENVLFHVEEAQKLGFSQAYFILEFKTSIWTQLFNLLQKFQIRRHAIDTRLVYIFAKLNLPHLVALALCIPDLTPPSATSNLESLVINAIDDNKNISAFRTLSRISNKKVVDSGHEVDGLISIMFEYIQAMRQGKSAVLFDTRVFENAIQLIQSWSKDDKSSKIASVFLDTATMRHEETALFLLDNGARIDAIDPSGNSALHLIAQHKHIPKRRFKAQAESTDDAMTKSFMQLLIDRGADIDSKNAFSESALHVAVCNSTAVVVEFLIERGASLEAVNNQQQTALHLAICRAKIQIAKLLLRKGAKVTSRDRDQLTILHEAVVLGNEDLVRELLQYSADVAATDEAGWTPLHMAAYEARTSQPRGIPLLLVQAGAKPTIPAKNADVDLDKWENMLKLLAALDDFTVYPT